MFNPDGLTFSEREVLRTALTSYIFSLEAEFGTHVTKKQKERDHHNDLAWRCWQAQELRDALT